MHYLDIHTHHTRQNQNEIAVLSLSVGKDQFPTDKRFVSVGLHPWYIDDNWKQNLEQVAELAKLPQVKLIGECGLDKLKGAPLNLQIDVFEAQLKIAQQLNKPVLAHCVKAFDELIACCKKNKPQMPVIIHGFNKKPELAKQLTQQGFVLSYGSALLKNHNLAKSFLATDDFLLETDDGNHSISEIYQLVAEIKNCSVDELKELIFGNWYKLGLLL